MHLTAFPLDYTRTTCMGHVMLRLSPSPLCPIKRLFLLGGLGLAVAACSSEPALDARAALNVELADITARQNAHLRSLGVPLMTLEGDSVVMRSAAKNSMPDPDRIHAAMQSGDVEALNRRYIEALRTMRRVDPARYARLQATIYKIKGQTIEQLTPELR